MSETVGFDSSRRRLFFALWPDDVVRQQIERDTRVVVRDAGGRPIPSRNFHVTLVFIGEVPQPQVAAVMAAATEIAAHSFTLTLDTLESWTGADVLVYSGERPPPALGALVDQLRISLLRHELKLRLETFKPHITLARKLSRHLSKRPLPSLQWTVSEFVLVDSRSSPEGSLYTVIGRWPLA